jgi:iron complex transport system substrate-binding protein
MRLKTILSAVCACCLLLSLCGCGSQRTDDPEPADPDAETFTDDLGRTVTASSCQRVAAMIGSFADIWCLAGGRDSLVAAAGDTWTSFDLGLGEDVADLGAVKAPSLETLLAAEPDLVLASCNTDADVELLDTFEQAGLCAAYFDIQSFDDYLRMLDICTRLTGCRENYDRYGSAVAEQVSAAVARQDGSAPTVLCVRATGAGCKVKGSTDNLLGEMLADLGCVNVADGDGALLESLSLEAIIAADPDDIFVVLQGSDPTDAQAALEASLLSNPAWSGLRAVREGRFYTLDNALYNLKPNARWGEAYEQLADILYPA